MRNLIVVLSILLTLASCGDKAYFEENISLNHEGWRLKDSVSFNVPVNDTITVFNFALNIRNTNEYPYSNLYTFIDTKFPNGKVKHDTMEVYLADPKTGEWFGEGFSNYFSTVTYYQARFPQKGNYQVFVRHAMRDSVLDGIIDVGFKLYKAEEVIKTK